MPVQLELPPLTFEPIYKEKIWGGQSLKAKLNKNIPSNIPIGESWEISGVAGNESRVANGPFANQTLCALMELDQDGLVGKSHHGILFPLLYKFLDARQDLSIQSHPNDKQAQSLGLGSEGKTECWYIIDAQPDTKVICGFLEGVELKDVKAALDANRLVSVCNFVPVSAGDVIFVPAGTVHAMLANTVLYEVQQTSDVTFRLYDWDRLDKSGKPRQLHIEQALATLDMTNHQRHRIAPVVISDAEVFHSIRIACRYFAMEEYWCEQSAQWDLQAKGSFQTITVLSGSFSVSVKSGEYHYVKGETALFPASGGAMRISAAAGTRMLTSYAPDLVSDIIAPLVRKGVAREDIERLGGNPSRNDLSGPLRNFPL
jgi:mannose-6-phosphate isomerase